MEPIRLMNVVIIGIFVAAVIWLFRGDRQAGHVRTVTWLFVGATSISWMEAVWDWVLYYRFNPDVFWLWPDTIPVLGMAGGWPIIMPMIYGPWFVLLNYVTAKQLVARDLGLKSIAFFALILGAVEEFALEIPFLFLDVYAYTRSIPGANFFTGTQQQYPFEVPILMAPVMAFITVFIAVSMRRQKALADGTATAARSADTLWSKFSELRAFGGSDDRKGINAISVIVASHIVFFIPMIPALIIRFAGWRTQIGDIAPFGYMPYAFPF